MKRICAKTEWSDELVRCPFVLSYLDEQGMICEVVPDPVPELSNVGYKPRKRNQITGEWEYMKLTSWHRRFDEAQKELNFTASKRGWKIYESNEVDGADEVLEYKSADDIKASEPDSGYTGEPDYGFRNY
ncbi:MAG: hypothetical protein ACC608_09445 [Anaerofustis sp.]